MSYSIGECVKSALSLLYTKVFFRHARLVRRPIFIRGKRHLTFGEGFTTGYGCRFDLGGTGLSLVIGKNCKLNDRVHIVARERVEIGDNVLMASNIFISDTSHGNYDDNPSNPETPPDNRPLVTRKVLIGSNVWIGENVSIMPGCSIGAGSIIGANSVVTKSFPKNVIAAGVPAAIIKQWNPVTMHWELVS